MVKKRFDLSLEIPKIDSIDLCRDLQGYSCPLRDFYRAVRALFRCDTPDKSQITTADGIKWADMRRETVRDPRPSAESRTFFARQACFGGPPKLPSTAHSPKLSASEILVTSADRL